MQIPSAVAQAPSNGGIEALTTLADGRLLIIAEELENPDGSVKAWVIDDGPDDGGVDGDWWKHIPIHKQVPKYGPHIPDPGDPWSIYEVEQGQDWVTDPATVIEFGGTLTLVKAGSLRPGAKLDGKELLRLEQPLAVENFEGIAVQQTSDGTMIFIVSDDNYSRFQQTLLLQFLLPHSDP